MLTLLRLSSTLFILIVGLMFGALAVGAADAANPALLGFRQGCEDQPQPCWYGIIPGVTDVNHATAILEGMLYTRSQGGYELSDRVIPYRSQEESPRCTDIYFGYRIIGVRTVVLYCMALRIGDVMTMLGPPHARISYGPLGEAWLYDRVVVRLAAGWQQQPSAMVDHIRLLLDNAGYVKTAAPWHGFLPRWRYCQLEPNYAGC
ncbi:MAG: hypothetical protein JNJ61_21425 [Anaerolineae bacterium]|nr:hypothetical protein [Anaerolineae bacterium]